MSENINPIYHMMHGLTATDWVVAAAAVLLIVLLVWGLAKKVLWMVVVAVVLGVGILFCNPAGYEEMKDNVIEFFDNAIKPMEDDDYSDLIGEDIEEKRPGSNFGDIGQ